MTANASAEVNTSVSIGTIVRSPNGRRWIVSDPNDFEEDGDGSDHYWLRSVTDQSEKRGIGKRTFGNEGWEVLA